VRRGEAREHACDGGGGESAPAGVESEGAMRIARGRMTHAASDAGGLRLMAQVRRCGEWRSESRRRRPLGTRRTECRTALACAAEGAEASV
jgi:hypothetical protein